MKVRRFITAWWAVEWARPFVWALLGFLVLLAAVEFGIGMVDLLRYAVDIPSVLSALLWLVSAVVTFEAARAVGVRAQWWPSVLFLAMSLAAVLSLYVFWVDIRSPHTDGLLRGAAMFVLFLAALIAAPLVPHVRHIRVKAWSVVAVVAGLAMTQFVIENQVLPGRTAPTLDVSAVLEEIGRTGDVHHMRGRVTWKNNGKATAHLLASLGTVTAFSHPAAALPTNEQSAPSGDPAQDSDSLLAMARSIDPVSYSSGVYEAELQSGETSRIIWMEDLTIPTWFVQPGQSETREFTFSVNRGTRLELRVDAWFVVNLKLDTWRTCDVERVKISDPDFLDKFHSITAEAPNPCMWAPLRTGNSIRYLAEDSPYVIVEYRIRDEKDQFGGLFASFSSLETVESRQAVTPDEVERITRTRPVAGAAVVVSWIPSESKAE